MKKSLILISLYLALNPFTAQSAQVFPISTDMQIGKIKPLIERAPSGIYLTVGGERSFRGASMFDKIEHLIIVDMAPAIIRFSEINKELLKATDKEAYKELRWNKKFADWKEVSDKLTVDDFNWWNAHVRNIKGYSLPEELNKYDSNLYHNNYLTIYNKLLKIYSQIGDNYNRNLKMFLKRVSWNEIKGLSGIIITEQEFEWWRTQRNDKESCASTFIDKPEQVIDIGKIIDYKTGNYLFSDHLYQNLHNLAINNRITIIRADLTKELDLDQVISQVKKINHKLALLDLNNLYFYDYMGENKMRYSLDKLTALGDKESILILMSNYKKFACAQFSIYLGFTFENVKSWPKSVFLDNFINRLPEDAKELIDGKLYEGNNELPL